MDRMPLMARVLLLAKLCLNLEWCLEDIVQKCLEVEAPDREQHIRTRERARLVEIRRSWWNSLGFVSAIGLCGIISGLLIDKLFFVNELSVLILRILASLIVAWAVLSKPGKKIESWGGKSLPEQLDNLSFRIPYFIGASLFICTLFLSPETGDRISIYTSRDEQHEKVHVDEEPGLGPKVIEKQSERDP